MYMAAEYSIKKTYDVKCLVLLFEVSKYMLYGIKKENLIEKMVTRIKIRKQYESDSSPLRPIRSEQPTRVSPYKLTEMGPLLV